METQDTWVQNSDVATVVIDNFVNMFGDTISKEVIIAVIESCGGDFNLALEGMMKLTADNCNDNEANASSLNVAQNSSHHQNAKTHHGVVNSSPNEFKTNTNTPDVITSQITCNGVVQFAAEEIHQPFNTVMPAPSITSLPNVSYASASQNTGAIPKAPMTPRPCLDNRNNIWTDQLQQILKDHNQGSRILILLRGAPGSGKSYLAKKIVEMTIGSTFNDYNTHIFSTDNYFIVRGNYIFDKYKLSHAHTWNQGRVREATQQGLSPIIVDNTNIQCWEMEPYLRAGVINGYIIEVMEPTTPWAKKAYQLARKNIHGAPITSIKRMLENFDNGVTGASLRQLYGLSYPTTMIPPVLRNIPVLERANLLPTADTVQVVQAKELKAVVVVEDPSSRNTVTEQTPPVVTHQDSVSVINEYVSAISIDDNKKPNENKNDFLEQKPPENEASSGEIKLNNVYEEAQKQLEKLHSFELAWETGENWEELQEEKKCKDEVSPPILPKEQRKNLAADLPTVSETSTASSIPEPASSDILMESVTKCNDWRQISMFMPSWNSADLADSRKSPDIPIETMSSSTCMEIGDTDSTGYNFKVISAIPRDINEFYIPPKEKIPEKRMLDKSSMTNDNNEITEPVRCKNEEKHFIAFRKLFRNIPRTSLRDIFDQCCGDVNWAVEIVLDGMANNELPEAKTEELSDEEEEVLEQCTCLSAYQVIPNVENANAGATNNEQNAAEPDEPASSSQSRRKSKKDAPVSDTSMLLKRQIEKNVAISESHYSEHCLKIRKMRRGECSGEGQDTAQEGFSSTAEAAQSSPAVETAQSSPAAETAQTSPAAETAQTSSTSETAQSTSTAEAAAVPDQEGDDSDDDYSIFSSDETEKVLTVNLGAEFVKNLDAIYGRKDMQYPENIAHYISIPVSILNEINALWMESIMNQLDNHTHQSALMLKQDEEFARELERKELELAEAGIEPFVPDFKEIMDLDMALSLYHNDILRWRDNEPKDLAAKLSREKLFNLFPDVSPDVLSELLMAHDNNFQSTVEVLLVSTGRADILSQENGINKFVMDKELERRNKMLKEQKSLCEVEWPLLPKGEVVVMETVNHYREEAEMHLFRRNQCYQKAQDYVRRGATKVANFYSEVASFHKKKFEQANSLAASSLIQYHAANCDETTIDLHYLRVSEAKESLDLFIDTHIRKLKENLARGGVRYINLFFITGRGRHSPGLPRVKPAVKKRLTERRLYSSERNPGLLTARVTADDLLTCQIP